MIRSPLLSVDRYESRHRFKAAGTILLIILLERIAFYSLLCNFYLYLTRTKFGWSSSNALQTLFIFSGISYVCCFIGGIVADLVLDKFKTIVIGFVLFSMAYLVLPFTSSDSPGQICAHPTRNGTSETLPLREEACADILLPVAFIAAVGSGIAEGNSVALGAEQLLIGTWVNRRQRTASLYAYMNWTYWCINLGAIVAFSAFAYIQQLHSFFVGYIIPSSIMIVATLILVFSFRLYTREQPTRTFRQIFSIMKNAYQNRRMERASCSVPEGVSHWLDWAKQRNGGRFHEGAVEDIKALETIIIFFLFLVPYRMLYFQMLSTFLNQGLNMRFTFTDEHIANGTTMCYTGAIPASMLGAFDGLFLLIAIPVVSWLGHNRIQASARKRIMIGMFFATLAMVLASVVEFFRRQYIKNHDTICQWINLGKFNSANMSIAWQIPQYSLMGISEVFCIITGMEFAFSQAPTSMQSAIMGLFYFISGIASFLGLLLLHTFQQASCHLTSQCCTNDINDCNMSYYFAVLAIFQLLFLILFFFVSRHLRVRGENTEVAGSALVVGVPVSREMEGPSTNMYGSCL